MHLRLPDGTWLAGFDARVALLCMLPGLAWLGWLMARPARNIAMKQSRRIAISVMVQAGIQLAALVWGAMAPPLAFAYDHPLTSDAVRASLFLGARLEESQPRTLAPYLKSLPVPGSGPDVAEIELRTPFVQVVEDSAMHSVSYSAQDAATAYQKRGDFILVRVKILLTPTYTNTRTPTSGATFQLGLVRKENTWRR